MREAIGHRMRGRRVAAEVDLDGDGIAARAAKDHTHAARRGLSWSETPQKQSENGDPGEGGAGHSGCILWRACPGNALKLYVQRHAHAPR